MSISKKQWVEKMKEKLQTGEVWPTELGERLYHAGSGMYCGHYLVCDHDPWYCPYRSVPRSAWEKDDHAKDIRQCVEEIKKASSHQVVVHSADDVLADFYNSILGARGIEGLMDWVG